MPIIPTLNKVLIHARWTTKDQQPLISKISGHTIHEMLRHEFAECGCKVYIISGDHVTVHCLFRLNPKRPLDEIVKMVKGATSHRINQLDLIRQKFTWQKGYAASSVSENDLRPTFHKILQTKKNVA